MYVSEFCEVSYNGEPNLAFVQWKKFCRQEEYRTPLRYALGLLQAHDGCNYCADTRDGFENEEADTKWLFEYFLPSAAKTTCKKIFFIIDRDNALKEELDGQSAELGKLFAVHYCFTLEDVGKILAEESNPIA